MSLKKTITMERIAALKGKNSARSQTLSLVLAAIKQQEVDTRTELDDPSIVTIIQKMIKQRLDSIEQFIAAKRTDLSDKEEAELKIIKEFLPEQASEEAILASVTKAFETVGSATLKDMGKIMALVKAELAGKADMSKVSQLIKSKLA